METKLAQQLASRFFVVIPRAIIVMKINVRSRASLNRDRNPALNKWPNVLLVVKCYPLFQTQWKGPRLFGKDWVIRTFCV